MTIQLDLMQAISLIAGLVAFMLGGIFTVTKLLLAQFQRRLDDRFEEQDKARLEGSSYLRSTLESHLEQEKKFATQLQSLERDFLSWRADLPLQYVRREDYIRGQTVIEAKLDALYSELKLVQIKGAAK